jgi:hypothetical protein
MIARALTGGIGLATGAVFSGAKYEYADSFNLGVTKPKYSGEDLEQLEGEGVHVIVVSKKTASAEMDSARNSCRFSAAPAPQTVLASAPQTAPQVVQAAAPAATQAPAGPAGTTTKTSSLDWPED